MCSTIAVFTVCNETVTKQRCRHLTNVAITHRLKGTTRNVRLLDLSTDRKLVYRYYTVDDQQLQGPFLLSVSGHAPAPDHMGPEPVFTGAETSPVKSIQTKYLASTLPLPQTLSLPQMPNGNSLTFVIPIDVES